MVKEKKRRRKFLGGTAAPIPITLPTPPPGIASPSVNLGLSRQKKPESGGITFTNPKKRVEAPADEKTLARITDLLRRRSQAEVEIVLHKLEKLAEKQQQQVSPGGAACEAKAEREKELHTAIDKLDQDFALRHGMLEGALTASQVITLLECKSRQTPHDRRRAGSLFAIQDNGVWKFPVWQFDAKGPDGVLKGLPEVLQALGSYVPLSEVEKAGFLTRSNPYLGGRTPLEALKSGSARDRQQVVALARAVGVS